MTSDARRWVRPGAVAPWSPAQHGHSSVWPSSPLGCGSSLFGGALVWLEPCEGKLSCTVLRGARVGRGVQRQEELPEAQPGVGLVHSSLRQDGSLEAGEGAKFNIASVGTALGHMFFSPDGTKIAFCSDAGGYGINGDLGVVSSSGGAITWLDTGDCRLASDNAAFPSSPWSPDGEWVVYSAKVGSQWDLFKIRPDGSQKTRLTNTSDEDEVNAVFSPRLDTNLRIVVSQVRLCWDTEAAQMYQVQYRSLLTTNQWTNLGSPMPGTGGVVCETDGVTGDQRYYRVIDAP